MINTNKDEDIILSIIVSVYNHEKYVAQALNSILMQKTSYKYEILAYDDASTDNSAAIIRDYEKRFSSIRGYYYKENMFSRGLSPAKKLLDDARGKYLIVLEGDDYWIDENKIDIQIDFLETHSEYLAVAHNCVVVNKDSIPNGEEYPECKDCEYELEHYENNILPGQTATLMYRNYYRDSILDTSFIEKCLTPGDRRIVFSLISNGKIYCIQKTMSAYRHIVDEGDSFSANPNKYFSLSKMEEWLYFQLKYAYITGNQKAIIIAENQYFGAIYNSFRENRLSFKQFCDRFREIKNKSRQLSRVIKYYLSKYKSKKNKQQ